MHFEQNRSNNILLIEDHQDLMKLVKRYLEDRQFNVTAVGNAEEGLESIKEQKPDLILLDLMLPGMSGKDFMDRLTERRTVENYLPIIIITAKKKIDDIVEGLNEGADDYIIKPFNMDELYARIKTTLRMKTMNELLVHQSHELENANERINQLNQSLIEKNADLRKTVINLHDLFDVSMELTSILDLQRLINSILLMFAGRFGCKKLIFFYPGRPMENRLKVMNSKGFYQDQLANLSIEKSDPIFSRFRTEAKPVLIESLTESGLESSALRMFQQLDVHIISPIIYRGQTEGIICFGPRVNNKPYERQDMEQIVILSNMISIAVTNAALYQEVKQLSYTDGMTELHNFRYFELRLREEIVRHKRTENDLSLLILDVDHFKNYNDTMGHPAGDEVLRKLGQILKHTVRENDIVARYGGEEFAIILPEVKNEGARILAERIRSNVETARFEHQQIQPDGKITVSIGVASLPEDADDYRDLISKSDTALYVAKRNGRNQVQIFNPKMVQ